MNELDKLFLEFEKMMSKIKPFDIFSNIERGELFVLKFLNCKKTSANPSMIALALETSLARISATLKALEKRGEIMRSVNLNNRREVLVEITEEGKIRIEIAYSKIRELFFTVSTQIGTDKVREFIKLATLFFETTKLASNDMHCDDLNRECPQGGIKC
ncbi:MAG: transcriptional regulator [Christensenellaceae bacterium]|jgi:DNA-binding MarR family transcriptional regulator|nr:transcriptional regulator [Christensenellaceae bacterium]